MILKSAFHGWRAGKSFLLLVLVMFISIMCLSVEVYGQSVPKITFQGISIATPAAPSTTTNAATNVSTNSATLNGTVDPNEASTSAWFEWGTDSNLSTFDSTSPQNVGSGASPLSISAPLSTLSAGTKYYYRAAASNSLGTIKGSILNFTTIPAVPVLASPPDAATGISTSLTLMWNSSTGAASYTLQLSKTPDFSSTVVNQSGIATSSFLVAGLDNNTTYYWRVNAKNAGGTSDWSAVRTFTTILAAPTLASPSSGDTLQSTTSLSVWTGSSGADTYRLQVSIDSLFTTTVVDDSTLADTTRQIGPLSDFTTYFWRVNAKNSGGASDWSSVRSFTTGLQGDFSGDNTVDVSDLVLFAAHFGLSVGNPGYDAVYDLTGDLTVDVSDLVVFASVFGAEGPGSPVQPRE